MTAYNFSRFIRTTIASVQQQTLRDIEIVVVDDCSPDSTYEIVVAAATGDDRIRPFTTEVNSGTCAARNLGIEAARGQWIAILDGDDAYHPRRLESLVATAERRGADVVADNTVFCDHETWQPERLLFGPDFFSHEEWLSIEKFMKWVQLDRWPNLAWLKPMMRRSFLIEKQIRYAPGLGQGEDFLIMFSFLAAGAQVAVMPDVYYFTRERPGSVSRPINPKPGYWRALADYNNLAKKVFASCDNAEVWGLLERQGRTIAAILTMSDLKEALGTRNAIGIIGAGLRVAASPAGYAMYSRELFRRLFGRPRTRQQFDPSLLSALDDLREWESRPAMAT